MKKLLAIALLSTLFLFSCEDDDKSSENSSSLIGKWKINSGNFGGEEINIESCSFQSIRQFKVDNTAITEKLVLSTDGSQCIHNGFINETYFISGNEIKLTESDGSVIKAVFIIDNNILNFNYTNETGTNINFIYYRITEQFVGEL